MHSNFNESDFEKALIQYMSDELGYTHICGYDIDHNPKEVLFEDELRPSLKRINPSASDKAIDAAIFTIKNKLQGSLDFIKKCFGE